MLLSNKPSPIATFKKTNNFAKPNFRVGIFESDVFQPQHLYILSDEEIKEGDWYVIDEEKVFCCENGEAEIFYCNDSNNCKKIIGTTNPKLTQCDSCNSTGKKHVEKNNGERTCFKCKNKLVLQLPQHIIEAYVKKPFDMVMVEYEGEIFGANQMVNYTPKLNSDGTLAVSLVTNKTKLQQEFEDQTPTIKVVSSKEYLQTYCVWLELQVEKYRASLIEEKMYSKEEVEKLLWSFYYRQIDNGEEAGIWIKENL